MWPTWANLFREMKTILFIVFLSLLFAGIDAARASESRIYQCATSDDVYKALEIVGPGDTIMLEGGKVYEIGKSFKLRANGLEGSRITFTSNDSSGQGRFAVISTVGQKKEKNLVALKLTGSVLECFPIGNKWEESATGQ